MFRLAHELSSAGLRVLTTTTTHISEDQARIAPASIGWNELGLLDACLDRHRHCLLAGPPDGKGRIMGTPPDVITSLRGRAGVDIILVEADGSKSRPFKAPGEHEPVVPEATTILVPVAGIDSIGKPLDGKTVHRPEIAALLAAQPPGSTITSETLARVLAHPRGGAKQLPAGARLVPLLNRADTEADIRKAGNAAERLLASAVVDSVIISAMNQDPPVREAWAPAAGIVLAAGLSTRFGAAKQTLAWKDTTLAEHAARAALEAGLDPVVVVLGSGAENVEKALEGLPVQIVFNPDYAAGQSTSVRKGLGALPPRTGAALFILADQPLVDAALIRRIVQAHRHTFARACVPVFEGKRGNPVLFDSSIFGEFRELSGDTGGKLLLGKYRDDVISVPAGPEALADIDTPEDYERLRNI